MKSRWIAPLGGLIVLGGCRNEPDPPGTPLGTGTGTDTSAPSSERPNFVLILADDLDATATPYWDAMPRTRGLLADRGLTFSDANGPTPICCPARASILTGKLGHNTGVLTNGGPNGGVGAFIANGNEDRTLAVALESGGYRTSLVGKYMNGIEDDPSHIPPGWTEWYAAVNNEVYTGYDYTLNENGTLTDYGDRAEDYATDVFAKRGIGFIESSDSIDDDQPFFLMMTPTAPHLPLGPPPRYAANAFVAANAPRSPNYEEADLSDKPMWLQQSGDIRADYEPWVDEDYRNRMGSLLALDDLVVSVVDALESADELEDTVLIFTSDNGYNNGSHRLIHKMAPYTESLQVPLVVAGPGITTGSTAATVTEADYAPTILDLAGIVPDPTWNMDGRSLRPILTTGETPPGWRTEVFLQYESNGPENGVGAELTADLFEYFFDVLGAQDVPTYTALRDERWKAIEWIAGTDGQLVDEWELYDRQTDPFELENLVKTQAGKDLYRDRLDAMQSRMRELSTCVGSSCP